MEAGLTHFLAFAVQPVTALHHLLINGRRSAPEIVLQSQAISWRRPGWQFKPTVGRWILKETQLLFVRVGHAPPCGWASPRFSVVDPRERLLRGSAKPSIHGRSDEKCWKA